MTDFMLDLETMGRNPGCAIMQIGACQFDRKTGEIGKTLLVNVDLHDCVTKGFVIDPSTLYWWMGQSDSARKSVIADPRLSIRMALLEYVNLFDGLDKNSINVWCHATFDLPILHTAMNKLEIRTPYHYAAGKDIRTAVELAGINGRDAIKLFPREGEHHTALDDCKHQVKYLVHCLNRIQLVD
jgi:DNA polymerase III epsilon subunit-like protein